MNHVNIPSDVLALSRTDTPCRTATLCCLLSELWAAIDQSELTDSHGPAARRLLESARSTKEVFQYIYGPAERSRILEPSRGLTEETET